MRNLRSQLQNTSAIIPIILLVINAVGGFIGYILIGIFPYNDELYPSPIIGIISGIPIVAGILFCSLAILSRDVVRLYNLFWGLLIICSGVLMLFRYWRLYDGYLQFGYLLLIEAAVLSMITNIQLKINKVVN
jgi:hypothetical protein